MVKLGPKLPPPTRRELARQEKEAKRAAQLANGFDPALLGEPREHLALLLAKKTRSKRLETSVLEHSRKRWEKNQKRAQARRLAKAFKENINTEGSQEHSQSVPSPHNVCQDNAKVLNIRGDSAEVQRIPYLDSTSSDIHGIPVGSRECPLDTGSGELPSMSSIITTLSLSSSDGPEILESGSVSMLPYASNAPRLGVDISTGDFWAEGNAASSSSPDLRERNETAKITLVTQTQGNQVVEKSIDPPQMSSQVPPDTLSRVSSLRKSRTIMNAAMAPPRLFSRKGSASSFIFSEPLDLSKYSNKSSVTGSGHSQRGDSGFPGNAASSGHRVDSTPNASPFRGLNLTLRAKASPYLNSEALAHSADQTVLAKSKGRVYDIHGWDSSHVTWKPPAAHSNDFRSRTAYTFGTIAATSSLEEQIAKGPLNAKSDIPHVEVLPQNVPDVPDQQTQVPASMPTVSESLEPPPVQRHILRELSNNTIAKQPEPHRNINASAHNPIIDQVVQKPDSFSSNVANIGASTDVQDVDQPVTMSESAPMNQNEMYMTAVLAPAACIIQDKKAKVVRESEVDETQKGSRKNLFNIQPTLKAILRPSARENGNEQHVVAGKNPDTPPNSWSGIVPPASTPATRSPLIFAMGLPSPPWFRPNILPRHVSDTAPEAGTSRGFVSALKWVLRKTFGYFWQLRG